MDKCVRSLILRQFYRKNVKKILPTIYAKKYYFKSSNKCFLTKLKCITVFKFTTIINLI